MGKISNKVILIGTLILLFTSCSNADNKGIREKEKSGIISTESKKASRKSTVKFINSTIIPDKYKSLGAVKLIKNIDLNIDEGGMKTTHYFQIIKVQNYEGKKDYSDKVINYDKRTQKLIVNDMYTVTQGGKIILIPKNQTIEQDDELTVESPQYVFHKNRIINFPNIEPGMSIVMDYTIIEKSNKRASNYYLLDSNIPILKSVFIINYPEELKLKEDKIGDDFTKKEGIVNGKKCIIFTKRNSEPLNLENNTPDGLSMNKDKIIYTFYEDWSEIGKKLENINIEPTKEISDLSNKIIEDYKKENKNITLKNGELSKEEKIKVLYSYVLNNITTKRTYLDESDFKVGDLSKVIYQKYGDTEEVNALFIGLLKAQGIKDVVPIAKLNKKNRESIYQSKYPMDNYLSRLGVKISNKIVVTDDEYDYLDVFDSKFNYISKKSNYEPVVYEPEKIYQREKMIDISIVGDRAYSDIKEIFRGSSDYDLREFKNLTNKERITYFSQDIGSASDTLVGEPKFNDFNDYSNPMEVQYRVKHENYIIDQGAYKYFNLPFMATNLDVSLNKRKYDYQIRNLISKKQILNIDLSKIDEKPIKYKMVNNLNKTDEFKFSGGIATFKVNSEIEGDMLKIVKEVYIPSGIVDKKDYSKLKKIILEIENPIYNKVFLKEVNK